MLFSSLDRFVHARGFNFDHVPTLAGSDADRMKLHGVGVRWIFVFVDSQPVAVVWSERAARERMESPGLAAVGSFLVSAVDRWDASHLELVAQCFPALGVKEQVKRAAAFVGDAEQ